MYECVQLGIVEHACRVVEDSLKSNYTKILRHIPYQKEKKLSINHISCILKFIWGMDGAREGNLLVGGKMNIIILIHRI